VPANDDAIRSIKLFTRVLADAIVEGRGRYLKNKEFLEDKSKKTERPEKAEHAPESKDPKRPSGKKTGADVDIEDEGSAR
jgi:small subunit ribosomal protein S2